MEDKKNLRVQQGDLAVFYRRKKVCLVLSINPVLGSGFQSADILWSDEGEVETVMLQYLKVIQKSSNLCV